MELYFELSQKQLKGLKDGTWSLSVPYDIKVDHKDHTRACFIEVDDENKEDVIEYLENQGISWQKND